MTYETQRWGVEIEAYNLTRERVTETVREVTDDVCINGQPASPLYWAVVDDGSIRRNHSFELRSPAMWGERESWDKLRAVCKALRDAGAQTGVTCGFHVHHDAAYIVKALSRSMDTSSALSLLSARAVELYALLEPMLDTIMPPSRRGTANPYCRSMVGASYDSVARLLGSHESHYYKLSVYAYNRHGTFEYRQHAGTLLADKMIAWIKLTGLIHTAASRIALKEIGLPTSVDSLDAMMEYLEADTKLTAYYSKRQEALAAVDNSCTLPSLFCLCQWCRQEKERNTVWLRGSLYPYLRSSRQQYVLPRAVQASLTAVLNQEAKVSINDLVRKLTDSDPPTRKSLDSILRYIKSIVPNPEEVTVLPNAGGEEPYILAETLEEVSVPGIEGFDCSGGTSPQYVMLTKKQR